MSQYYSSLKVRLLVRFEDYLGSPTSRNGLFKANTQPEAFGGESFEALSFDIVPYDCSVTLNSYREADQASITIPFRDLPLDPRVIRAAAVQIFAGAVPAENWARAVGTIHGNAVVEDNRAEAGAGNLAVVADTDDVNGDLYANEIFRGFVDTAEVSQRGDDTLVLECRDMTSIFLDAETTTMGLSGLPKDMPLDEVIRQIIIGEAVAADQLSQAPPEKWEVVNRQNTRSRTKRLSIKLGASQTRINRLNQALASAPLADIAGLSTAIAQEVVRSQTIATQMAVSQVEETTAEKVPILAQRYGLPGARGTKVINETQYNPMPTLGEIKGVKWFDSKKKSKKASNSGASQKINYWDLITDLCVATGFICYLRRPTKAIEGSEYTPPPELVITDPRTYYGDDVDPESGATVLADEVREFAYGFNCNEVTVERSLTGKQVPQHIQVNARTSETGELVSVRFPPVKDKSGVEIADANRPRPSKTGEQVEVQTILYKGDLPKARANEILFLVAKKVYEELGRNEFLVTIRTQEFSFLPANRSDRLDIASVPDIFQLKSGDTIRVGRVTNAPADVARGLVNQLGVFNHMGFAQRTELFLSLGFSKEAATAVAEAYESDLFQDKYRVRSVGINFNRDKGFEFEIQAVNYLDARNALDDSPTQF